MDERFSPDREDIIEALSSGESRYSVSKRYPTATVYRIYKELQEGKIVTGRTTKSTKTQYTPPTIDVPDKKITPISTTKAKSTRAASSGGMSGVSIVEVSDSVMPGAEKTMPIDALNAVRGILGMITRPKVLSMPTPELLYPAMIISIEEWGWQPMRPNDFIDTVLDKFLSASDIEYNTYIKRSVLEEIMAYAHKGGYNPPGNSLNIFGNNGDNDIDIIKEEEDDGTTGTTEPAGEQDRGGGESWNEGQDQTGRDNGGQGGDGSPPI